jgi:hypothetical protein
MSVSVLRARIRVWPFGIIEKLKEVLTFRLIEARVVEPCPDGSTLAGQRRSIAINRGPCIALTLPQQPSYLLFSFTEKA